MDIVLPRVAGIDVHMKVISVAVRLPGEAPGERTVEGPRLPRRQTAAPSDGRSSLGHRVGPYPARCPVPPPGAPVWPRNEEKAAIAVAHALICIAWAVMARGQDYADVGEDHYDQCDRRNREHLLRHHQQALARLGYQVTLVPPGDGSPPPGTASSRPVPPPPGQAA